VYKRYTFEEVKRKIFNILEYQSTGMSGIELARKTGINRMTITKYLNMLYSIGLIRKKKIGIVNVWFLEAGLNYLGSSVNYNDLQQKFMNSIFVGNDELSSKVIVNALDSGADAFKLLTDVFLPTINTINELNSRGRLNRAERINFEGVILEILDFVKYHTYIGEKRPDISALVISGSEDTIIHAKLINLSLRLGNCDTRYMGNLEGVLDPFFDIDFQRYVTKLWGNRKGSIIVCVCSSQESSLRFFYSAAVELRNKLAARVILCLMTIGELVDTHGFENADRVTDNPFELLVWLRDFLPKLK
jgi:predicted transcriptional regulator